MQPFQNRPQNFTSTQCGATSQRGTISLRFYHSHQLQIAARLLLKHISRLLIKHSAKNKPLALDHMPKEQYLTRRKINNQNAMLI